MSVKEEIYYGTWSIGDHDISLSGILKINYKNNSCVLNLYSDEVVSIPYFVDVIHGKTYEGKAFTCYKCDVGASAPTSYIHDYKKKYIYEIGCQYMFEGLEFLNSEDIIFEEVYFSVSNLNKWAFQEAIKRELNEDSEYVITTKTIDDITHQNEDFKLSVSYSTMTDYGYKSTNTEKISTDVKFIINFTKPSTIEVTHKIINQIRNFVTLCTTLPTYIEYLTAIPNYPSNQKLKLPIKIYGRALENEKRDHIEKLSFTHDYISLLQISENFNISMKNWFEKNEKLKPVIDLYVSVKHHKTSYERHFLNLVQALEAYHRLTRNNKVLPSEEHKAKLEIILKSVPEEHKEWLRNKLMFSNEPSLHERLDELLTPKINEHAEEYPFLFGLPGKNKIDLIRDIKNTRNYNTHFDERLFRKTVKGEELIQLIFLLITMVEFYLLQELNIDTSIILEKTRNKTRKIHTRNSMISSMEKSYIKL